MKIAKIITFIAFSFNGLLTVYYLLAFSRIRQLSQELGIQARFPWVIFIPAIFAIGGIIYWFYLKNKTKEEKKVNFAWVASIILLIVPLIFFLVVAITSDSQVLQMFNEFSK